MNELKKMKIYGKSGFFFSSEGEGNLKFADLKIKGAVLLVKARHAANNWEGAARTALPKRSSQFFSL